MTFHDEILTDLLDSYLAIPPWEPIDLERCYQSMGFWLAQLRDEDTCSRWVLRWIYAIQVKYPDLSMVQISLRVQERITQALAQEKHL